MSVITYSLKESGKKQLSKNFQVSEFASHDGDDVVKIDTKLVLIVQDVRDHFDKKVTISSGYRSPNQNKKSGGANASYHMRGQAADIVVESVEPAEVAKYLESKGVKGIGLYVYPRGHFVHCDTRTSKYYWKQTTNAGYFSVSTFGGAVTTLATYKVNAAHGLRLRSSMNTNLTTNIICIMPYESSVVVLSSGSTWSKVQYTNKVKTNVGYCYSSYIKKS